MLLAKVSILDKTVDFYDNFEFSLESSITIKTIDFYLEFRFLDPVKII